MTYRAAPVTQRDGSKLEDSNCLMATAAVGLDYHTLGKKTSTGKKMREYSGDTSGGTNTDEIERAWHTGYDEDPITRDGQPFSKVIEDLKAGRLVMLQVWAATVGSSGMCLSGSGAYGHGISVAPEQNSEGKWLVADPWCDPPKWKWVAESKLKAGAEEWVQHSASGASGHYGREWPDPNVIPIGLIIAAAALLMTKYTPSHPSPFLHPPAGVGGSPGVLFASTAPHLESDVAINTNGSHMTSARLVRLTADAGFYKEPEFVHKYGTLSEGRECVLLGPALGTNAFAILVNTSKPYDDGQDRETVVYITKDKASDPYAAPEPPPSDIAARDAEWRAWLDGDGDAPDK